MLGVLAHGLPAVVLPQSADNFANADLLVRFGAAAALLPVEVTADGVRSALRDVLESASYRQRALRLANEITAMPSPDTVAATLAGSAPPSAR